MAAGDAKNWTNPSRLLFRQIDSLRGESMLIVAPPDDGFASFFAAGSSDATTVHNFDYRSHSYQTKSFGDSGHDPSQVRFGYWYSPRELHDSAIVYLPKGRDLIEYVLRMTSQAVAADGSVYLVGANDSGIRSVRDRFAEIVGDVVWSEAARHCVVYAARNRANTTSVTPSDFLQTDECTIDNTTFTIVTLPGVFSRGRLDAGTEFLLSSLPRLSGRVLDFGCGCGIVGATIKRRAPGVAVEFLDSSAAAVESARLTLEANAIDAAKLFASDGFSEVEGRFDAIVSNPPFHRGVGTDYGIVEELIERARNHLNPGGSLFIVANRFLKYKPLLERNFTNCTIIAENNAYRVYQAA